MQGTEGAGREQRVARAVEQALRAALPARPGTDERALAYAGFPADKGDDPGSMGGGVEPLAEKLQAVFTLEQFHRVTASDLSELSPTAIVSAAIILSQPRGNELIFR